MRLQRNSVASPRSHASSFSLSIQVSAPAKLNLTLEIAGKRPDRYHEIRSVMVAIDLCDHLTLTEAEELSFSCDVPALNGTDNLVLQAARLLQESTGCSRGAAIFLEKRIPWAAGLGGGSSDAASALVGLNELWSLNLSREELATLGSRLGSDVNFFFSTPLAWCWGRGEKTKRLVLGRELNFVLVAPKEGLSTPSVFRELACSREFDSTEDPDPPEDLVDSLRQGSIERLAALLKNDLQEAAMRISPSVQEWYRRLQEAMSGRAGTMMSGSGSSLFALCRDRREAEQVIDHLQRGTPPEMLETARIEIVRSCESLDEPLCS